MEKYIFFDFNGTIIDDVVLCYDLLNKMLNLKGKQMISIERYKEIFKFPIIEYYELAGFSFPDDDFPSLAKEFVFEYKRQSNGCLLMPGIIEILKYLEAAGYKLVCLSASEVNMLKKQLDFYKLSDYFVDILGINDFHASSKVDIAISYIKSNKIDKKNAYMIGDTLHDKKVADAMGINSILYSGGHQSKARLLRSGSKVIEAFSELKDLF